MNSLALPSISNPKRNVTKKNLPLYLVKFYFSKCFCTSVHDCKCYVNPINMDKTLALYFQRPHGVFRIVNEMIERQ